MCAIFTTLSRICLYIGLFLKFGQLFSAVAAITCCLKLVVVGVSYKKKAASESLRRRPDRAFKARLAGRNYQR